MRDVRESSFGVRLWRLLSHRGLTFDTSIEQMWTVVAGKAGIPNGDLSAVVKRGVIPDSDLVRRLAPALGIHTADLFVIAGLDVPDDLASAWPTSPWNVGSLLRHAVRMRADQRRRLEALVRAQPVQSGTGSAPVDGYPDTPERYSCACYVTATFVHRTRGFSQKSATVHTFQTPQSPDWAQAWSFSPRST